MNKVTDLILINALVIFFSCEKDIEPPDFSNKITIAIANATDIQYRSAKVEGKLGDTYGKEITDYGHCWDTLTSPTLACNFSSFGPIADSVIFTSLLNNLLPGKKYFVRAYFIFQEDTIYSEENNFSTLQIGIPTIATDSITNITAVSAIVYLTISSDGGDSLLNSGICWSLIPNPTIQNDTTSNLVDIGSYEYLIDSLVPNTIYYLRAYANNSIGTSYGKQTVFTTTDGLPELTTTEISTIGPVSASAGGMISQNGGFSISERGVCWNTTGIPTTADHKTIDGSGGGLFTSEITGLTPDITYYVRAYAKNSIGTSYGEEKVFTTTDGLPELTTTKISNIGPVSASSGGMISNNGGFSITERGVCWNTTGTPTTSDNKTIDGIGGGLFTSEITGLSPDITYYVRAYAKNFTGTSYGNEIILITHWTVTDIDGNIYNAVTIGLQIWMAENLKTTRYSDGTSIPLVEHSNAWNLLTETDEAYCYYDNESTNGETYGALYNWVAAMNSLGSSDANPSGIQGVCPTGWHLPSDAEWKELELYIVMYESELDKTGWRGINEGDKLKSTSGWDYDGDGNNETGFNALPAGERGFAAIFNFIGYSTDFWSSTTNEYGSAAITRYLSTSEERIGRADYADKAEDAYSIRCIKD